MKSLSFLLLIGLFAADPVFACRVPIPTESRIREANAVLIGTVTATEDPAPALEARIQHVSVRVGKTLKGKSPSHVEAISICAPTIRVGGRIVVLVADGQKRAYQGEFYEEVVKRALLKPEIPATKVSCEKSGGRWGTFGLMVTEECDMPTSDAGRKCSSHAQCQSVCVVKEDIPEGKTTAGRCFNRTMTRGTCLNYVKDGIAQGGLLCSD